MGVKIIFGFRQVRRRVWLPKYPQRVTHWTTPLVTAPSRRLHANPESACATARSQAIAPRAGDSAHAQSWNFQDKWPQNVHFVDIYAIFSLYAGLGPVRYHAKTTHRSRWPTCGLLPYLPAIVIPASSDWNLGGRQVPTLDSQILAAFLTRIGESDRVTSALAQGLSDMLGNDTLPKPEDLVQLYAANSEDISA